MNDIYDHAPECDVAIWLERAIETDAPRWLGVPDDVACQCQKLRACEQRVRDEHSEPDAYRGWVKGYDDALRDVVRAISTKPKQIGGYAEPWIKLPDAIAAIDALREGTK